MKNTDSGTSQVVLVILKKKKNTPVNETEETEETQVQFLDQADSLEKGMATHPVFLPGESHGQTSSAGYSPWCHKESGMTERLTLSLFFIPQSLISPFL